jgi:hypothetical protein
MVDGWPPGFWYGISGTSPKSVGADRGPWTTAPVDRGLGATAPAALALNGPRNNRARGMIIRTGTKGMWATAGLATSIFLAPQSCPGVRARPRYLPVLSSHTSTRNYHQIITSKRESGIPDAIKTPSALAA